MAEKYTINHVAHASGAETVTGQSAAIDVATFDEGVAFLAVTAASGTAPTLDVKVQMSHDGTTWHDEGTAFAQVMVAATPAVKKLTLIGRSMRYFWTIGGTTPSFTFSINTTLKG